MRKSLILTFFILTTIFAQNKIWIFFTDKCLPPDKSLVDSIARMTLSERAIRRREKLNIPFDEHDVPVCKAYIDSIRRLGYNIVNVSRWLNAVSVIPPQRQSISLSSLSFVRKTQPVVRFRHRITPIKTMERVSRIRYWGQSMLQAMMVGADIMHQRGYRGRGVLIGMLDSGYKIDVPPFDSLVESGRLVAKYDFVHHDTSVGYDSINGDWDPMGFVHGTMTLSCIAADIPDQIMGIAPEASIALAKTEIVDSVIEPGGVVDYERRIEEDNWVAGIEWLDSIGVDIVTSSLGYTYFTTDGWGYSFSDLDGNTAVTTIAADLAAKKGIAVFNSAGNQRMDYSWGHIVTPADGDSVCAVGAVNGFYELAPFSSPGPTADGRIKPDLSALGVNAVVWDPFSNSVVFNNGTSFSCPIVAATAALVLQALREKGFTTHGWELIELMKSTADMADSPNNDYGWGVPKAPVAAGILDAIYILVVDSISGQPLTNAVVTVNDDTLFTDGRGRATKYISEEGIYNIEVSCDGFLPKSITINHRRGRIHRIAAKLMPFAESDFVICYPNPFRDTLKIIWSWGPSGTRKHAEVKVFSADGEFVRSLETDEGSIVWDGTNSYGRRLKSGVYMLYIKAFGDGSEELKRKIKVVMIR